MLSTMPPGLFCTSIIIVRVTLPRYANSLNFQKDGLAKYIGSLKRRNLIQRTGWQQFSPTNYAISLMRKAECGV